MSCVAIDPQGLHMRERHDTSCVPTYKHIYKHTFGMLPSV